MRLAVDYVDLIIAALLALYVSYGGIRETLKGDELTQATVALLGVLAIVIFRERWERTKAVEGVERALNVATAVKPWRVLNAKMTWELVAQDGSLAIATTEKDLRIEQDEVFAIHEWHSRPIGEVTRHEFFGRPAGEATFRPLRMMLEDLPGPGGRTYRIISLEGLWRRGQRLTYRSERDLKDFFKEPRESIAVVIEVPTDEITITVIWPKEKKPYAVELERSGRVAEPIDASSLKGAGKGRVKHVERISAPKLGEKITISWQW